MTVVEQVLAPVVTERERRARVLEAAALEIEVRGWCPEYCQDEQGRVCAVGAITAVSFDDVFAFGRYAHAAETFGYEFADQDDVGLLPDWNDQKGRTAEEVTFVLRWRAQEIRDGR